MLTACKSRNFLFIDPKKNVARSDLFVCSKKVPTTTYIQVQQFATFAFLMMQFVFPSKFCLSIISNFSRDQQSSLEKVKTKLMQNFVGKANCIMGNVKVADNLYFSLLLAGQSGLRIKNDFLFFHVQFVYIYKELHKGEKQFTVC